ncbi:unnamed protein product [Kuraishia capsulata CBS 1993]|uniref:Major facilitator superfamily (MFS) profile domain-containing protein n=1 Tax=Kuraishia capsulata CBS 1993 TaxID=1382522 RepID=W6MIC7_9ASCO|nr:uncharacterized protein KUCA_T00001608001 [Kuraishia capsulata CBS 1993]CDK25638.1 unnamed protein product [Kuraishia capsulata CBS 1993]
MHINTEAIPGSVHLVDESGDLAYAIHEKEIVLVPTPSDHPDDPLNWSKRRKYLNMFCMVLYVMALGVSGSAVYSVITDITEHSTLTVSNLNTGTGVMFLFCGWGNLIWQPMALQYGKRPAYLFSVLGVTFSTLWEAYVKTGPQWIGSKILQGFFVSSIESLPESSVADIFFEHERGNWMSLYALVLCVSNYIAPLVAGFIAQGMQWKWVIYWTVIFDGLSLIFLFFFWEETNYFRPHIAPDDEIVEDVSPEMKVDEKSAANAVVGTASSGDESGTPAPTYTKKSFVAKLKLLDRSRPFMLWKLIVRPVTMLRFPGIVWAGFCYGSSLIWFNVLNGTASTIFSADPYYFSTSMIGLTYISPIIFCFIFSVYAGWFGDWLRLRIARRRGTGISEPEDRLWLFALYLIIAPCSLILWGVGAYHKIHWIGIVFGMGLLGGSALLGCACSVNYVYESYKDLSGLGIVSVILIRNTMSFGMNYGITPWVDNQGLNKTFIAACGISIACNLTFLPVVYYGKRWRNWTKAAYWTYVQDAIDNGMVH